MGRTKKDAAEKYEGDYLPASFILDNPKNTISVSPALDIILAGGWQEGTIGILESAPKVGKTTLALKIASKAQQQFDRVVIYVSAESRLSIKNLKGVPGLDLSDSKFKIISSKKGDILSTEQFLERTEQAINEFPGCFVIFDSFSSLSSADEKTNKYGEGYGGMDSRKLEGQFARRVAPLILTNDGTLIGIAHRKVNIGSKGTSAKISEALLYHHDIRLLLKKDFPNGNWLSGNKLIGQKINIECLTSALGAPGGKCNSWLKFGEGFVDAAEVAELACDLSLINKSGSWYHLEKYNQKAQGFDDLCQLVAKDVTIYSELLEEIKSVLQ